MADENDVEVFKFTEEDEKELELLREEAEVEAAQKKAEIFKQLPSKVRQLAVDIKKINQASLDIYNIDPEVSDRQRELEDKRELSDMIFNGRSPFPKIKEAGRYYPEDTEDPIPSMTIEELEQHHADASLEEEILDK